MTTEPAKTLIPSAAIEPTESHKPSATIEPTETTVIDASTDLTKTKNTNFFDDVYLDYANKLPSDFFDKVKIFAEDCGYVYDIIEPTEYVVGMIKYIKMIKNLEIMYIFHLHLIAMGMNEYRF